MSKPTVPQWDSLNTNTVALVAGHKTDGWATDEVPTSAEMNEWMRLVYLVALYYDAAVLEGAFEFTGNVQIDGGITGSGGGAASFPDGLTATTVKFTTSVSTVIPTFASKDPSNTHTVAPGKWIFANNNNEIYYPLTMVQVGDVLTEYDIGLQKNDTNNPVTSTIVHSDDSGDHADTSGATSSVSPGLQLLGESGLSITVAAGTQYYIRIRPGGTISPSADRVFDVTLKWKRP